MNKGKFTVTCQDNSTLIEGFENFKIGDRVVILEYDLTPFYNGEFGTIVGFSTIGHPVAFVQLDKQAEYKCLPKWMKPGQIAHVTI